MRSVIAIIVFIILSFAAAAQPPEYQQQFKAFDLISDMTNHIGINGALVFVRGFNEVNDGFGGYWYWDSSSFQDQNGQTVFSVSGVEPGRWIKCDIYASNGTSITDTSFTWAVIDSLSTPPVSPLTGDKYLVSTAPTGAWVGQNNNIATWDGAAWTFEEAELGDYLINGTNSIVSKRIVSGWIRIGRAMIHQGGDAYGIPITIGSIDNRAFRIRTHNVNRIIIPAVGSPFQFVPYGSGAVTGTPTYCLAVDAAGNVIEVACGGGGGSTLFALTGLNTATGDVTGNLDGHKLDVTKDFTSSPLLTLNSIAGEEQVVATTDDLIGTAVMSIYSNPSSGYKFVNGAQLGSATTLIQGDASLNNITYAAGTHILTTLSNLDSLIVDDITQKLTWNKRYVQIDTLNYLFPTAHINTVASNIDGSVNNVRMLADTSGDGTLVWKYIPYFINTTFARTYFGEGSGGAGRNPPYTASSQTIFGFNNGVNLTANSTNNISLFGVNLLHEATSGVIVSTDGFGVNSLFNVTTGDNNTAYGTYSMNGVTTQSNNVAIGAGAFGTDINDATRELEGVAATSSTALGINAGNSGIKDYTSTTTYDHSIFIGRNNGAATQGVTLDSTTIIGNYVKTDLDNVLVLGGATQNVIIPNNTLTPSFNSGSKFQTPSISLGYVTKGGDYTLGVFDHTVNFTATATATLPTAVGIGGRLYCITNTSSSTITVATTSSQTFTNVSGAPTTLTLVGAGASWFQSDGANWLKLNGSGSGGESGSTPNLQQVTDVGNTTTNPFYSSSVGLPTVGAIGVNSQNAITMVVYDNASGSPRLAYYLNILGGVVGELAADSITDIRAWQLPDASGIIPLAITDGISTVYASKEGVIDISGTIGTLSGSATLDFPSVASLGTQTLTITVTGAADGDVCVLGIPNGSKTAGLIFGTPWVSSADTVSIECYNSTVAPIDPASGTFKVRVIK